MTHTTFSLGNKVCIDVARLVCGIPKGGKPSLLKRYEEYCKRYAEGRLVS